MPPAAAGSGSGVPGARGRKPLWKTIRKPLPAKTGGPHGGKKGARGYERPRAKARAEREDPGAGPAGEGGGDE